MTKISPVRITILLASAMGLTLFVSLLFAHRGSRESSEARTQVSTLPSSFHRGVNHAHIHRRGHGYGSAVSATELAALRDLGVTWIAITPFGYQRGATASEIVGFPGREGGSESSTRRDSSLTDADLAAEIKTAHSLGLRVVMKPHIWSRDFGGGGEWHGSIRQDSPADHARWWASYRAGALHYAQVAEQAGADLYCVGTELVKMTTGHESEWRELIGEIRLIYRGPLTYAAHWDAEFEEIGFWDVLDYIGVGAYFPLSVPPDAGIKEMVRAWQPHRLRLEHLQRRVQRPVLFLEVGYRPVSGGHQEPWQYRGGELDPEAQARAYEAVFRAFVDASWWHGTYFWKTFTDPRIAEQRGDGRGFSFRGRPAEDVLRQWYDRTVKTN